MDVEYQSMDSSAGAGIDPSMLKKRGLLGVLSMIGMGGDAMDTGGEQSQPYGTPRQSQLNPTTPIDINKPDRTEPRLAHRINDDQQTGNRSGGPAGGYQDPGAGRLRDLVAQQDKLNAKPTVKGRLLGALQGGLAGAGTMARDIYDKRQQEKIDRRKTLASDIEAENREAAQREFTHGEDVLRQQTAERGLNERARLAEEAERGRNERLVETIKGQGDRNTANIQGRSDLEDLKQSGRDELEDRKQVGRMAVQHARAEANAAIARFRAANKSIPPPVGKAFDSFEDSQSRMDVMEKSYADAIKDPGNQQAQLNLLANHLGMTMGLQKGARLNQHIIDEAKRSGYIDERIEAHFGPDGYMTGVVLTPRQMGQMVDLAHGRLAEDARKVTDMETYFGVQGGMRATPKAAAGAGGGAGATSNAPKTAQQGAHKIGDTVKFKGVEHKVTGIRSDGSLELSQ